MITIWRADFEGNSKQLERFDTKFREIAKRNGGQVDGPFLPQTSSLLYIVHHASDKINAGGPELLSFAQKEKIPITPISYEIAHTPDEFWGRGKLWG
ncbi:MAG TPA: hypothetical protein VGR28_09225 [Candidatus Thermoplasmatota archaeon]|jgi:hypothetical protein|nr:hypothetical protein [Candidatus Thermoplasmatota archaeon]